MDRDQLLRLHETMLRIRCFEEAIGSCVRQGQVRGLFYSQRGQEGPAASLSVAMQPGDYLVTTYRGNGDMIAAGADMRKMAAEILGRSTGYCRGKGGVMHIAAVDAGVLCTTGIVGGGLPIATGAAYSAQIRQSGQVTFCTFGDGATNQGAFHEALNMASLWSLPVVYICYNNEYAEATARHLHQPIANISQRALGLGIPGRTVDGMKVEAVTDAVLEAAAVARNGGGPTLIEARCFRFAGHYLGDPMTYMPPGELTAHEAFDPITLSAQALVDPPYSVDAKELEELKRLATREADLAIQFAESSPEPEPSELLTDVVAR